MSAYLEHLRHKQDLHGPASICRRSCKHWSCPKEHFKDLSNQLSSKRLTGITTRIMPRTTHHHLLLLLQLTPHQLPPVPPTGTTTTSRVPTVPSCPVAVRNSKAAREAVDLPGLWSWLVQIGISTSVDLRMFHGSFLTKASFWRFSLVFWCYNMFIESLRARRGNKKIEQYTVLLRSSPMQPFSCKACFGCPQSGPLQLHTPP